MNLLTIFIGVVINGIYDFLKNLFKSKRLMRMYTYLRCKIKKQNGIKNSIEEARRIRKRAERERDSGHPTIAIELFAQAEKIYEEEKDTESQVEVLLKMSILENTFENKCEKAREYREKAEKLLIENPETEYQRIELKMGAIFSRWAEYDKARNHYDNAETLSRKNQDNYTLADVLRLQGIMEGIHKRDNLDKARDYLYRAKETYMLLNDEESQIGQAKTFQALGDVSRENNDYLSAVENYNKAYCFFSELDDECNTIIIMCDLYVTYALLGNEKVSQEWRKRIDNINSHMPEKARKYVAKCERRVAKIGLCETNVFGNNL